MLRIPALAAFLATVVTPAAAQVPPSVGDLYLHTATFEGSSSAAGALVRYDPLTGLGEMVVDIEFGPSSNQRAAFDPSRGGVLFVGEVEGQPEPASLWLVDGAGALTNLGLDDASFACLAPAPDGKVYGRDLTSSDRDHIVFLGDDGALHELLDASGTAPFKFTPNSDFFFETLIFHTPTRSLIAAGPPATFPHECDPGGTTTKVVMRRVSLSADGTRAVGPTLCNVYDASLTATERAVGLTIMSDGDLLMVTQLGVGQQPRMVRVDPATLATSTFASNGPYLGDSRTDGGGWSSVLDKAVILDTRNDDLIAYAGGETGAGTPLNTNPPTGQGGSGNIHTLFEITSGPCAGAWRASGDGLVGFHGVEPVLAGTGCLESGEAVTLHLRSVRPSATGVLFAGLASASLAFKGGTLHLVPAFTLPVIVDPTGLLDLPLVLPLGLSGTSLFLQGAFADPAAVQNVSLTAGLEMEVG